MWNIRCSFNRKAQTVNKVQRQLRPEPYFPEFFKSRAQDAYLELSSCRAPALKYQFLLFTFTRPNKMPKLYATFDDCKDVETQVHIQYILAISINLFFNNFISNVLKKSFIVLTI